MTVPLLLRPANPPVPFVGRSDEMTRIAAGLQTSPVVVVWGFSGIGKSALVSAVLARQDAATRVRMLLVDIHEVQTTAAHAIGAALARVTGTTTSSAGTAAAPPVTSSSPERMAAAIVDTLEAHGLWLILEGVERLDDDPVVTRVVDLARRFGQSLRVVVVCREDPRQPALVQQTTGVGPMPSSSLLALLQQVNPGISERDARHVVDAARGSPWRALQLSLGVVDVGAGPEASLLALSPAAQGVIRTLALVPGSLPLALLGAATRLPAPDVLESLTRRGYLETGARGVRLHSAARPLVEAVLGEAEVRRRGSKLVDAVAAAADEGAASNDGDTALAILDVIERLVGLGDDVTGLEPFLLRYGRGLRARGAARRLWRIVNDLPDTRHDALFEQRCRLALDVGDDALAGVRAPTSTDAAAQAWWLAVRVARGEPNDVGDVGVEDSVDVDLDVGLNDDVAIGVAAGRAGLLARGWASLEGGALADARHTFQRVADGPSTADRLAATLGLLAERVARGHLDDVDAALAGLRLALQARGRPHGLTAACEALRAVVSSMRGAVGAAPRQPWASTMSSLSAAVGHLVAGDASQALAMAIEAGGRARAAGQRLGALEADVVVCDAAIVVGDDGALAAAAAVMARESAAMGSERFALEARFAHAATVGATATEDLVAWARATDSSPVVARRARALLGEDVALDAVDRAVVAAWAARSGGGARMVQDGAGPEWTVEAAHTRIVLADGRVVDFSTKRVLFDLLSTLCRRGGQATKEQLLQEAWGVRDYHPLHHDNRLKVAVRKLRRLLEDALGDDPIEAADDGYRLRGRVRYVDDAGAG